jgi:hydrogenase maturation protease
MTARAAGTPGTLVVGIGQPLGGDDAVGLAVAERLRTDGIRAHAVGDGAALVDLLAGAARAVIIDAVVGAGPPGTVVHLRGEELEGQAAGATPVSSHGLSVAAAVATARALGGAAEAHLVGVAIDPPRDAATSLSREVAAAVEVAALRVREILRDQEP